MKLLKDLKNENGVVAIFVGIALIALVGIVAYVVDTGSIYQSRRSMQSAADAAALAGAQELPNNPDVATQVAIDYAVMQSATISSSDVSVSIERTFVANDTIKVSVSDSDKKTFFAGIFGINSTNIGASATAMAGSPEEYIGIVPWVVIQEKWVPGVEYKLDVDKFGAAAFKEQHTGASTFRENIFPGYNSTLVIGDKITLLEGFKVGARTELVQRVGLAALLDDFYPDLTNFNDGIYSLKKPDTQYVIVPIISQATADSKNGEGPIIGFAPFIITNFDDKEVYGTFLDEALVVYAGSISPFSATGIKVIRLIN